MSLGVVVNDLNEQTITSEHQKAVTREEVEKSGVFDHIWREKGDHRPL